MPDTAPETRPPISERKRAANQRNALLSTGPRSDAGKMISKFNNLKHGYRAQELILPGEDPQELDDRIDLWIEELRPGTDAERYEVVNAVHATWRQDRSRRSEAAALSTLVEQAHEGFDDRKAAEAQGFVALLELDPAAALRGLRNSSCGLSWLISQFTLLEVQLRTFLGLELSQRERAIRLCGKRPCDLFEDSGVWLWDRAHLGALAADGAMTAERAAQILQGDRPEGMHPVEFERRLGGLIRDLPTSEAGAGPAAGGSRPEAGGAGRAAGADRAPRGARPGASGRGGEVQRRRRRGAAAELRDVDGPGAAVVAEGAAGAEGGPGCRGRRRHADRARTFDPHRTGTGTGDGSRGRRGRVGGIQDRGDRDHPGRCRRRGRGPGGRSRPGTGKLGVAGRTPGAGRPRNRDRPRSCRRDHGRRSRHLRWRRRDGRTHRRPGRRDGRTHRRRTATHGATDEPTDGARRDGRTHRRRRGATDEPTGPGSLITPGGLVGANPVESGVTPCEVITDHSLPPCGGGLGWGVGRSALDFANLAVRDRRTLARVTGTTILVMVRAVGPPGLGTGVFPTRTRRGPLPDDGRSPDGGTRPHRDGGPPIMLTLFGPRHRYCDGVSRRSFLKIGGLAMGGLGLPELLRAEASGRAAGRSHKSVIMVYLSGGLAHQDTFDLKPDAPDGVRGEFKPIATSVPGVQVGELLPRMAASMDKLAVIRSLVGLRDEHSSFQNLTGFPMDAEPARGQAALRLGRRQGAGAGRPGRAAVRRPLPDDAAQAVQHPGPGLPRPAATARRGWTATTSRC